MLLKPVSIDGIAIPKEILWGGFEREGFQDGKLMPKSDDFQMQSGPGLEPARK